MNEIRKRFLTGFFLLIPILCLIIVNGQPCEIGFFDNPICYEEEKFPSTLDNIPSHEDTSIPFSGFLKNNGQLNNEEFLYYYSRDSYIIGFGISKVFYEIYLENEECISFSIYFPAASTVHPTAIKQMGHLTNFFDKNQEYCNVPSFAEIWYLDLYPSIDLRYYMSTQGLKYDFIVHPGGNPDQITLKLDNSLVLEVESQSVSYYSQNYLKNPILQDKGLKTYQEDSSLISMYVPKRSFSNSYGFKIASYDSTKKLIIDPLILSFSTYWGGSGDDKGESIAIDSAGNIYITGSTASTNFPIKNAMNTSHWAYTDVFVTKLNSTGTGIIYSTYIRGDNLDYAYGIAVDESENVFITGTTLSDFYPTGFGSKGYMSTYSNGTDAFVSKLNATGNGMIFSTGLGGSDRDEGYAIAIDNNGNSYIYGFTQSSDFPTKNAYNDTYSNKGDRDIFVTKLNANGDGLIYSTYIGGNNDEYSFGKAIAVDSAGNAYITGLTYSPNFPTVNAFQDTHASPTGFETDGFVTKIDPTGNSLIFSTFLGGTSSDNAYSIAVSSDGSVYVTGQTSSSTTFPITSTAYQTEYGGNSDCFITKFNATGNGIDFSTFLGGDQTDFGWAIDLDTDGNCYITGGTYSSNFPMKWAYDDEWDGNSGVTDVIIAKLDSIGENLKYSTYLKGDSYEYGRDLAIANNDQCYVTGFTASTTYPTFSALNTSNNGGVDAFITKVEFTIPYFDLIISSPANNTITNQAAITVEWSVNIVGGEISYYEVFLNEVSQGTTINSLMSVGLIADDYYNITVTAYDMVGNTTSNTTWVRRDTEVPTISVTSPSNATVTQQTSITIDWTGSDTDTGVDHYEVFLNEISQGTTTSSSMLVSLTVDGYSNITVTIYDYAGNTNRDVIWIVRDINNPMISITSPINDSITNQATIIVEWIGSDAGTGIDHYEVFLNEVSQGTTTSSSMLVSLTVDSYYNITLMAYDKIGRTNWYSIWVQRDIVNPSISITSPVNDTLTNQNTLLLQWSGSDVSAGVDHYEVFVNGISQGTTTGQSTSVNLNSDGYHNITVVIHDKAGNTNWNIIWVRRDMTTPMISVISPANSTITQQSSIIIEWTGSDIGTGVDYYELFLNEVSQGITTSSNMLVLLTNDGYHNITIVAHDYANNTSWDIIWVIRDIYDPMISITSPANGTVTNQAIIIIEWTGSDTGTGIYYYEVFLNDVSQGTTTSSSMSIALDITNYYNITIIAYDRVGHSNQDTIWMIKSSIPSTITTTQPFSTIPASSTTGSITSSTTDISAPGFLLISLILGFLGISLVRFFKRQEL
ncbi:MAG: SBBP repeat-containing protein [Promethearchaeota archaeon]